jgi:hypothetical protein
MNRLPQRIGTQWRQISRRELLRLGGLQLASLPIVLGVPSRGESQKIRGSFGRAKSIIYLFMSGGPSQYETFDPKPDAPTEIRGSFRPIATSVPGTRICELLPRLARVAGQFTIVRSMSTNDPNHESGGYWVNTGYKYAGPNMRALHPTDWPTIGSIVKMLKPSGVIPFTSVMLPEPIVANPNVYLPGQNAGFLGHRWDPELFRCDPAATDFKIEGISLLDDLPAPRLSARDNLLSQVNGGSQFRSTASVQDHQRTMREAMNVVFSGRARKAFALDNEPGRARDRYGRNKWGQSVLLARRLVEAGVRMVFVNWPREPGDLSSPNPLWDTHGANDARMKDVLCPAFDIGFSALIEDLGQRGLLDETLVVAIGEMGRTARFNASGGRDHWGSVFSCVMAGAGIRPGQVYGSSDKNGAEPASDRVQPDELSATIFHLLGIGHEAFFPDRFGRPHHVSEGKPIAGILAG